MRQLFIAVAFLSFTQLRAQTEPGNTGRQTSISVDSMNRVQDSLWSQRQEVDRIIDQERNQRNIESILRYTEERKAKERKAAMLRIIFGIAMLGLLVVGFFVRRKKN